MKRLIVSADDAGSSPAVNRALREARAGGVVTCANFTATGAALEEACAWAREDPSLGAGAHLDLDSFFHPEPARSSHLWEYRDPRVPVPDIEREMDRQLERLLDLGLPLRQVSSRHHLHLRPELFPLVCDAARKFRIPAVRFFPAWAGAYPGADLGWLAEVLRERHLAAVPYFIGGWYWGNVDEPFQTAELACRPSVDDEAGLRDLAACLDPGLREHLRRGRVRLISFGDFLKDHSS